MYNFLYSSIFLCCLVLWLIFQPRFVFKTRCTMRLWFYRVYALSPCFICLFRKFYFNLILGGSQYGFFYFYFLFYFILFLFFFFVRLDFSKFYFLSYAATNKHFLESYSCCLAPVKLECGKNNYNHNYFVLYSLLSICFFFGQLICTSFSVFFNFFPPHYRNRS